MQCVSPMTLRRDSTALNPSGLLTVPCGKCYSCLQTNRLMWSWRLYQESKNSESTDFVTLTYDPEKILPTGVNKGHIQAFLKRLRHHCDGKPIKYFIASEYGPKTFRPHYHGVFFNLPFNPHEILLKSWDSGFVTVDLINMARIHYTTSHYLTKMWNPPEPLEPNFVLMSKGLGKDYLTPEMIKWHNEGMRSYSVKNGGEKIGLPRYFKLKIFDESKRLQMARLQRDRSNNDLDGRLQAFQSSGQNPYLAELELKQTTEFLIKKRMSKKTIL